MITMEKTAISKLPRWLEEMTIESPRPRPQSWRPPPTELSWRGKRETRRAITTPGRLDLSPVKKVFLGFEAEDAPGTPATYVASKREGLNELITFS
ncbi:hypothetical protein LSTR_LSTR014939 [Laodelphax striatellus]|uniref:Uncharacterized protein n=1 Tax=Laodelphax striatellus TaxID=195883 RepID=A0A482XBK0_LAOST|nr:hypothetical protein LSTR_LSTR014939 [Laodelphax striatellus]